LVIEDLIRSITDPEHPLTLEDLSVVSPDQITVSYPAHDPDRTDSPHVLVRFTPTIPHCSMATLIGTLTSFLYTLFPLSLHSQLGGFY
jgi:metal-sulfur cluster biosynthetic enzyme